MGHIGQERPAPILVVLVLVVHSEIKLSCFVVVVSAEHVLDVGRSSSLVNDLDSFWNHQHGRRSACRQRRAVPTGER